MSSTIIEVQVKDGSVDWRDGNRDTEKWMDLFNWG